MSKKAIIIAIGDELLNGSLIDTNSTFLQNQLVQIGISCILNIQINDLKDNIISILTYTEQLSADYIFITGGLGPTADDITLEAIAAYTGDVLIPFSEIKEILVARYKNAPHYNAGILKQTIYPSLAEILPNDLGTASGCIVHYNNTKIIVLPGVPFEMKHLFTEKVLPLLPQNASVIQEEILLIGRLGEVAIEEKISVILKEFHSSISIAYLPQLGYVKLVLKAVGNDFYNAFEAIKNTLFDFTLATADITLPQRVLQLCETHQLTIACGESCSGGSVGSGLTDIPGASVYYKGTVGAYANQVKEEILLVPSETLERVGAVSKETVIAMAHGVCSQLKTDVAITTSGILGPGGATETKPVGLVYIGLKIKESVWSFEHLFPYQRLENKMLTINNAYVHFILECQQLYR